jgi:hypothetical protein
LEIEYGPIKASINDTGFEAIKGNKAQMLRRQPKYKTLGKLLVKRDSIDL